MKALQIIPLDQRKLPNEITNEMILEEVRYLEGMGMHRAAAIVAGLQEACRYAHADISGLFELIGDNPGKPYITTLWELSQITGEPMEWEMDDETQSDQN